MNDRVLITGASGFIGFHLINEALKNNFEVFAAVRKNSNVQHLQDLKINYVYLDYKDPDSLKAELEKHQINYIIHAAGSTKAKTQEDYNYINAQLTINLALAASSLNYPFKKFVFISSLAATGPLRKADINYSEQTPEPVTQYGRSKLLAEKELQSIYNLPLVVLRPTAVYGPREKDIFLFFKTFKKGLEPYIGKKQQRLSFIYGKDLAVLSVQALLSEKTGVYEVSDGKAYSRYDMGNITKKLLNKAAFKIHIPLFIVRFLARILEAAYAKSSNSPALNRDKLSELTASDWYVDIKRLREDFDFTPQYDLQTGLEETLKWYKENKWL